MREQEIFCVKNYTIEEAIAMLPYIKSYCRSLKLIDKKTRKYARLLNRLSSMAAINSAREEKIKNLLESMQYKLDNLQIRLIECYQELVDMHMTICKIELGCIDIPVYIPKLDNAVYLCINPKTTKKNLEWHSMDESYEKARAFVWTPDTSTY